MEKPYNIHYRSHEEIDRSKWDQCIARADHPLIYAHSWYLDHFCTQWEGLVLNDYEAVMPLTRRNKFGISYLYPPFLCAQLGVFGKNLDESIITAFLQHIPSKFRYIDIYLNAGNAVAKETAGIYYRDNFVLDLSSDSASIQAKYRENTFRNIRKAEKAGLLVERDIDFDVVIRLARKEIRTSGNGTAKDFLQLHALLNQLTAQKQVRSYGVRNPQGDWTASAIFFFSEKRAYYILVGNSPEGRDSGASHLLIHSFIEDYAGKNMILDFEGSDVPGLAFFYSGFGAMLEKYPCVKWNRLPWYLKWLKYSSPQRA